MKLLTPQHFSNLHKGGTLTLAPGEYVTESMIVVKGAQGFNLRGYGVTLRGQIDFNGCRNFRIEGVTFDGDRSNRGELWSKPTLRVTACADFALADVTVANSRGDGVYISDGTTRGAFDRVNVLGAYRNGISVINGSYLTFESLSIDGVGGQDPQAGIDIEANVDDPAPHHIRILNADIRNVGGRSILGTGPHPPSFVTIAGCDLQGPVTLLGTDHRITDNRVDGKGSDQIGIGVRGQRNRVTGNDISNGRNWALLLAGPGSFEAANITRNFEHPARVGESAIKVEAEE